MVIVSQLVALVFLLAALLWILGDPMRSLIGFRGFQAKHYEARWRSSPRLCSSTRTLSFKRLLRMPYSTCSSWPELRWRTE